MMAGRTWREDLVRVLRGGTFIDSEEELATYLRNVNLPDMNFEFYGFRCARSVLPGEPGNPVTHNADWTPVIQTFDGVEMVLVPRGCFMMGNEYGGEEEHPIHQQCFAEPFWIDVTEVTNGQYGSEGIFSSANCPRDSVTWFEAHDFCASRGARLPTEAEWEYAARGPDDLVYPWGNEFVGDNVVYAENSGYQTAEVGSRPRGMSWVGAFDLSGNVWEWVSSAYEAYPYDPNDGREDLERTDVVRVVRGGSYNNSENNLRVARRRMTNPDDGSDHNGFRCARSVSS
jgi:iron(II)-dependent oxidoreductase